MIPIEIDKDNLEFRDLHLRYIKTKLEVDINRRLKILVGYEKKVLVWILKNIKDIIIGNLLRNIIHEFNSFIEVFNKAIYLDKIHIKKSEYKNMKKIDLVNLCSENISLKDNDLKAKADKTTIIKEQYVELIWKNKNYITVDDDLKYKILKKRINNLLKKVFTDFYEKEWDNIEFVPKDKTRYNSEYYDRYFFVKQHAINTCPYCNRNYISIVDKDKSKKNGLRPEIDHFFPKSIYPYLAMSFYNLIPSCGVCNHTKKSKDTYSDSLLSPYEIDENTFKLTCRPRHINFLLVSKRKYNYNNFDVKFKKIDKKSNEYFKLDVLYNGHKDIVLELLIKRTIYTKSYIKELKKNFKFTDDEIYRFLLCNYKKKEELHKRPLSKLIKDISKELKLI